MTSPASDEPEIPPESALLRATYQKSGLRVSDLAAATGLSLGAVTIALDGFRYRDKVKKAVIPPDATLVKLGAALRMHPQIFRTLNRVRAAELLEEALEAEESRPRFASDAEVQAHVAGRAALARQILGQFSLDELRAEVARRERQLKEIK